MNPDNVTPPEPNMPFGPSAENNQQKPPAQPVPSVPLSNDDEQTPQSTGAPTPTMMPGGPSVVPGAGAPAGGSPTDQASSAMPHNNPMPDDQSAQPTPPAVQPVAESGNPMPAVPTPPTGPKVPRSNSLPAILLASVVIIFLVVLAIYAFTKI